MENQIFFDLNGSLRSNSKMFQEMKFLRCFEKTTLQALALRLLPTARGSLLHKVT
jgi:hypothetical protein